jgi:hypothetical protein
MGLILRPIRPPLTIIPKTPKPHFLTDEIVEIQISFCSNIIIFYLSKRKVRWSCNPVVFRVNDSRLVLNYMQGVSVALLIVGGVLMGEVGEPAMQGHYASWLDL